MSGVKTAPKKQQRKTPSKKTTTNKRPRQASKRKPTNGGQKKQALQLIDEFEKSKKPGWFRIFTRKQVAIDLRDAVNDPTTIKQGTGGLCGVAAFLYTFAKDSPVQYVKYVTSLYNFGWANLRVQQGGKKFLRVRPRIHLCGYKPKGTAHPADWIAMASLRDSDNLIAYHNGWRKFAGYTTPGEMENWMKKVGYEKVINDANRVSQQSETNLKRAKALYDQGYRVLLLIHADAIGTEDSSDCNLVEFADHWVTLASPITIGKTNVKLDVYTWAAIHAPKKKSGITKKWFLDHYYGFVAGKY